ncbi:anti-sigma factor family protein [Streptomyces sp. enrichment culture]|uniref:anti-sigma factor family protein n=1 Tax=Streptomyces sp. enrichment culture TaxID=1795815 RepID=UPI003F5685FA
MTSSTDTAGHPDVAEISDLTEGLLPPSRSTDVRRHLEQCELCADVYASLEEIRQALGTLPGPPRMPADVAGRIDAALAAEALLASEADAADAAGADAAERHTERSSSESSSSERSTSVPAASEPTASESTASEEVSSAPAAHSEDDDPRVSRETSPAPDRPGDRPADRPAGRPRAATGPGRKDRRPGRRRIAVLGAAFTAAALGLGSLLLSSWGGGSPSGSPEHDEQTSASDTFAQGTLERQVTDLLTAKDSMRGGSRTPRSLEGGPSMEGHSTKESPKVFQQPTVPECVREGIGRNTPALATEEGVYKGREALLVVLADTADSSKVNVYIVDAVCVQQDSTAKAEVLLKTSYDRP